MIYFRNVVSHTKIIPHSLSILVHPGTLTSATLFHPLESIFNKTDRAPRSTWGSWKGGAFHWKRRVRQSSFEGKLLFQQSVNASLLPTTTMSICIHGGSRNLIIDLCQSLLKIWNVTRHTHGSSKWKEYEFWRCKRMKLHEMRITASQITWIVNDEPVLSC